MYRSDDRGRILDIAGETLQNSNDPSCGDRVEALQMQEKREVSSRPQGMMNSTLKRDLHL